MNDWIGNTKSVYVCNGASNHSNEEREINDFYATDPKAIDKLLTVESFSRGVWECACGAGHLVNALIDHGYIVMASDIVNRGCPNSLTIDFFTTKQSYCDIITNPPYKYAKEFIEHALDIVENGRKVAMFLKLTFLEGKARKELFKQYPPKRVYVFSERVLCAKNGDFEALSGKAGGAVAYAWFIWVKGYTGETTIDWI